MSGRPPRVAILGAGMAGLAAAWRLSEPGWQNELESITVYQRGWRLGGKGASSRGANGRIEEHGLHLWLGYYENSFRLLRECYVELDRAATDPAAPIRTWRDAMLPVGTVGLEDRRRDGWQHWLGQFTPNDLLPGEPEAEGGELSVAEFIRRALRLIMDFLASLPQDRMPSGQVVLSGSPDLPSGRSAIVAGLRVAVLAAILEASAQLRGGLDRAGVASSVGAMDRAISAINDGLHGLVEDDSDLLRTWHLVSVMTAVVRGVLADGLLTDQRGFRALNDEDFLDWIARHGAPPEVAEFAFIRGLYDLVFAEGGAERSRRGVSAGVAVFLTTKMFFEYRGAIFWKMAAGMGDIVFAPLYEALRRRGVKFEFFHRVDHLHLTADRARIEAVTVGRQVDLAAGVERYEPLLRFGDLPCFPSSPLVDQLDAGAELEGQPLESHFCDWPDAEKRVLRDGVDFDVIVFAISLGMAPIVCRELIDDRGEWRAMVDNVTTTATQAVQLWLREDEHALGWRHPGTTVSAYEQPLHTWASMPQLIDVECWPATDRPASIAYFCGALQASWPPEPPERAYVAEQRARVRANAVELVEQRLAHLLPGTSAGGSFRWDLLCGRDGHRGRSAIDTQLYLANVDPSDRYVQCAPGSDAYRLRAEESGYDNLVLAGDWTDNGLNAGCIEAATISGLQAANAVLGRSRSYRIAGTWLS
ncbi:MAG TPA: FAD-dependent oxidoreductase [Solirubrobacteraceae bacterium]|nr:FAD-dependent oxidoreductase [Solirubrobacteraceae bacterium]